VVIKIEEKNKGPSIRKKVFKKKKEHEVRYIKHLRHSAGKVYALCWKAIVLLLRKCPKAFIVIKRMCSYILYAQINHVALLDHSAKGGIG